MNTAHRLAVAWMSLVGVAASGCAHKPPEPLVKDVVQHVTATVEAIDPSSRMVMVRGPNGPATIIAGAEVRNFDQVRVGDKVAVEYYVGIAAEINKSNTPVSATPEQTTTTYTAGPGEKPAAGVGNAIRTTVRIESVDTSFDTVTFRRADGFVRTLAVESPEARKFIRTLRPGDMVDVTYTEAVAVAVVPGS